MLTVLLPTLLAGCSEPDPPQADPLPFDRTGAAPVLQLDRLAGRYTLPSGNLPADFGPLGEFDLGGFTDAGAVDDRLRCWRATLPFNASQRQGFKFAPAGMELSVDDMPLDYERHPCRKGRGRYWSLDDNELAIVWPEPPERVSVAHEGLVSRIERLEPARSGLSPQDFVRHALSIDDRTRQGLLLPAPATAEWDVTLPSSARFTADLALARTPLDAARSDGAVAVLEIAKDGAVTEVGRRKVTGTPGWFGRVTGWGQDFSPWEVDLSRYAGQQVTLRLRTEPGGNADWDYVFAGDPEVVGAPDGPARRVVVIALDTTRPDHLGTHGYHRDTSPELDAFAAGAAVFDKAWAPAPRTRPSFRSANTGRDPLDAVGATNIGEVFNRNGFATAGIVANVHLNPRFDFDDGFDLWWLDTQAKADDQVDRALSWLQAHEDRDTYLFLHIMDPHLFYFAPRPYGERWVEDPDPDLPGVFNRWMVEDWRRRGELTDQRKAHIEALYDGEIAWTSAQLGRFLEGLEALGGSNLVVLFSDHGEEFWEHDGFEHNHTLYDEVTRAALWVRPPEPPDGGVRVDVPATLTDIAPTLYDYAGFEDVPPTDGLSLRPLIEGRDAAGFDRPIGIGHLMYDRERWGVVVDGRMKYVLQTWTGEDELYDLDADPGEQEDLSDQVDTTPYVQALAKAHRMAVGPGWRVDFTLRADEVEIPLPRPALAAGVLDPETGKVGRANLAWGEKPEVLASEIATVTLSEDKRSVTLTRGARSEGRLYVLFDEPTKPGPATERTPGVRLAIAPGTVIVPPVGEAARMGLVEAGDGDDLELLEALGYIGGH